MDFFNALFQDPAKRLHRAIEQDDVDSVRKILKSLQGNLTKLKTTLSKLDDDRKETPLQAAIRRNHCGLVKALLDGGANPNESYEMTKKCAIVLAAEQQNVDLVLTMLAAGAEVNNTGENGETALMIAAQRNIKMVEILLEHEAEVNELNRGGYCPLSIAARYQAFDIIDLLLAHGAHLELPNMFRMTPLIICASDNRLGSVKYLIGKGANPLATENRGFNSFHLSIHYGFEDLVRYFLDDLQFDVNCGPGEYMPPIVMVASTRHVGTAQILLAHHANAEARNAAGATALMLACAGQQVALVQLLLDHGCDVQAVDHEGKTCLDYAVKHNRTAIVALLQDFQPKQN